MGDLPPPNATPGDAPGEPAHGPSQSEPAKRSEWWQRFGNIAQMVSALFSVLALGAAIIGFTIAYNQLQEVRISFAKRLWGDYLRLAVEKPDLATGDYDKIKADKRFIAYQAFVWSMLYACDEIAVTEFPDPGWRSTCHDDMRRHVRYLCEFESKQIADYAEGTQKLMTEVMNEVRRKPGYPECK
jgi:hypothetical protein